MNPEQYRRMEEVFGACCDLPEAERTAYLDEACGDDSALREEIERLLHSDSEGETFLAQARLDVDAIAGEALGDPEQGMPETIGPYRVVRKLGVGGMGIVYLATQDQPRRDVAVKVLRRGAVSGDMRRRFALEAQVLGQLQHPGIAHIYEAGTTVTSDGEHSYFAMEFVDGVPVDRYVRDRAHGTRASLELMARICDAVQHAHQKGVIHRDLKPGNILVTRDGQPKILDFGVARATDADIQTVTLQTDVGQLVGTIPYMSPEQVSGASADLDTRSDVYALGVITFELLAGRLPHEVRQRSIPEAARIIREEDPSRLSSVSPIFRGDVETIVAKALEKERGRRYASAAEFANDLRRYLRDEPIAARLSSAVYQLRKFAKRNRGLVAGVSAALIVLVVGAGVSTSLAITASTERAVAERQRDRAIEAEQRAQRLLSEAEAARDAEQAQRSEAERQTRIARAINDFLNDDLLGSVSPTEQGKDVTMQEVLAAASANITGKFEGEPEVEIAVRTTIADTYRALGKYDEVLPHLEVNLKLERRVLGKDHRDTLISQNNLALTYQNLGQLDEAERLLKQTLDDRRRVFGDDHQDVLESMHNLGTLYWVLGKNDEARPLMASVLERYRATKGNDHPDTCDAINNLSLIYVALGHYDDGVALSEEVVDTRRRVLGKDHPDTLVSVTNAGVLLSSLGLYDEAQAMHAEAHEGFKRKLGDEHANTIITLGSYGDVLRIRGLYEEAERPLTESYEACLRLAGPDHRFTLGQRVKLTSFYIDTGRLEEAEPLGLEALERSKATFGSGHRRAIQAMYELGRLYLKIGRLDEALSMAAEGAERGAGSLGPDHIDTLRVKRLLADIHAVRNQPDEAQLLYDEVLTGLRDTLPAAHAEIGIVLRQYGLFLFGRQEFDEAAARLQAAIDILDSALGSPHPESKAVVRGLVTLYERTGDHGSVIRWRERLVSDTRQP